MAILNPDHLLDQADRLISTTVGAPRQVDLRRAVSATYYALFHATTAAVADFLIGAGKRGSPEYVIVYRALNHSTLKTVCTQITSRHSSARHGKLFARGAVSGDLLSFSIAAVDLQTRRHQADYDPSASFRLTDARLVLATGRSALRSFARMAPQERAIFLALLAFPVR